MIGTSPVYFKQVPGEFQGIENLQISESELTQENIQKLLKYKAPWVPTNAQSETTCDQQKTTYYQLELVVGVNEEGKTSEPVFE